MLPALSALLVLVGVFVVVVASRARGTRRVADLRAVLDVSYLDAAPMKGDSAPELREVLARSGRAAERALGRTSLFARTTATLERSDWSLTAGEFAAVSAGAGLLGLLLGVLAQSAPLAVLLLAVGTALPTVLVSRAVSKRRSAFEEQLPEVLDLIAAALESGGGVPQALELVVAEADEPSASEFARVLAATRLGATLVEALRAMAARLDSRDLRYVVQAVAVQQRTGGKLAEVLRIVADFMRGRAEVKREISALTAEGRLSAVVLGLLPFGLAGVISLTNPRYLLPLFTTVTGLGMTVVAGTLMLVAILVMRRIIRIEV